MNIWENICLAVSGLLANKMRALLTMLGIIIGISSVIMITTLGNALSGSVSDTFETIGANAAQVMIQYKDGAENVPFKEDDLLTDDKIKDFKEHFGEDINAVGLSEGLGSGKVNVNHKDYIVNIIGSNEGLYKLNAMEIAKGRYIREKDINGARNVVSIPEDFAKKVFGNADPIGKELTVSGAFPSTYTVIGTYKTKTTQLQTAMMSMMSGSEKFDIYIPITTARKIKGFTSEQYYFMYAAKKGTDYKLLAEDVENYFNKVVYANNPYIEAVTFSMEQQMDSFTSMMDTMSLVITIIAGISLLVGGIGVMNIMLVSVTERTREIGVRKALGAPNSAIRIQFIVESMIICLIGGIIGIAFGVLLGTLGAALIGTPAVPSAGPIIVAVFFSMAIGVFFGYYPANKAAKLDPIEALRYE
ncbi:MAG: ABC transporter permease [Oscillospiraceae bacterium]